MDIEFQSDDSWYLSATKICAEALVQDLRQTHLVEGWLLGKVLLKGLAPVWPWAC